MSSHTTAARAADTLRHDIRAAYERLRARGALTGSVHGMGIDDAVDPHLFPGMKLDDAERLLRAADFDIVPLVAGEDTVYASSDTILPNATAGVRNEVVVVLTPRGTGEAAEIGAIDARIVVITL